LAFAAAAFFRAASFFSTCAAAATSALSRCDGHFQVLDGRQHPAMSDTDLIKTRTVTDTLIGATP
jgi:hypothetical protein